jgi:hypothetical protein
MGRNPKQAKEKFDKTVHAWSVASPDKIYGGISLEEYKKDVQASNEIRDEIAKLEELLRMKKDLRDEIDKKNLEKTERLIEIIIGAEGRDSPIYQALGYVRKSERKTGLTRKKSEPEDKAKSKDKA